MSDGNVVVTVCAMDVGPANILSVLAKALTKKGCEVHTFLRGEGTPIIVDGTKFLILGMSSSLELATDEILLAGIAKAFQIPTIFVADTFGVWNRPWFEDFIPDSTVFVLNEDEEIKVREKFPTANVVVTGNPCWDKFFFPTKTREMVRLTLGIDSDERVMLCPWGKNKEVNILHGKKAIEVAGQTGVGLVIISPHPGDMTPLEEYYPVAKGALVSVRFVTKNQIPCPDLIPGVDLVFESASTIGIEAVCQRVPVVDWFSGIALDRLEKTTGSRLWPLCEQGAAFLYQDSADDDVVRSMLRRNVLGYEKRLECFYPKPTELGASLKAMVAGIEGVAVFTH